MPPVELAEMVLALLPRRGAYRLLVDCRDRVSGNGYPERVKVGEVGVATAVLSTENRGDGDDIAGLQSLVMGSWSCVEVDRDRVSGVVPHHHLYDM